MKNGKLTLVVSYTGTVYVFNVAVQTDVPSGFDPKPSHGLYNDNLWFIGSIPPGRAVTLTLTSIPDRNNDPSPIIPVGGYTKVSELTP